MNPEQVETLGFDRFRFSLQPFKFIVLKIQPVVDLEVKVSEAGSVKLRSTDCEIRGNQYINQRFDLDLQGWLEPRSKNAETHLVGQADLTVKFELPPALRFTPKSLIESAGNHLLRGILATIKQRLVQQLLVDYAQWAESEPAAETCSEAN